LVYATCSLLPEENDAQVRAFLARHADAREQPADIPGAIARAPGWQLLPGTNGGDGFYYAVLEKAA
jgi:16S rRNA (cytosine967-C5)-methyltransferase